MKVEKKNRVDEKDILQHLLRGWFVTHSGELDTSLARISAKEINYLIQKMCVPFHAFKFPVFTLNGVPDTTSDIAKGVTDKLRETFSEEEFKDPPKFHSCTLSSMKPCTVDYNNWPELEFPSDKRTSFSPTSVKSLAAAILTLRAKIEEMLRASVIEVPYERKKLVRWLHEGPMDYGFAETFLRADNENAASVISDIYRCKPSLPHLFLMKNQNVTEGAETFLSYDPFDETSYLVNDAALFWIGDLEHMPIPEDPELKKTIVLRNGILGAGENWEKELKEAQA